MQEMICASLGCPERNLAFIHVIEIGLYYKNDFKKEGEGPDPLISYWRFARLKRLV
jgi:hypothetical protein